jgi:2-keto-4-pentenoate hydratase/2-oxohepta-3-ene-1,7-dioic acid hydratase in catechol pathway
MKLATFTLETILGPVSRFGVVDVDDGARTDPAGWGSGRVFDVSAAYEHMLRDRGTPFAAEKAAAFAPPDLLAYTRLHGLNRDLIEESVAWALDRASDGTSPAVHRLDAVRLRPPITSAGVLRDFAAFEDHLENTFGKMGLSIPPEWYERPVAFKGNPTHLVGFDDVVSWPSYTEKLDYELEVAAVVGVPGADIPRSEAGDHILGYTLLNDFSARDIQSKEMKANTGPFKAKDFAWGLGPWIVTPDELGDVSDLAMEVRVNGDVWATTTPGAMQWSFDEIVSYTSQDEALSLGDVFGSGTVNEGCGFEIDRWMSPGDTVELVADRIGVLRNAIDQPAAATVDWRRP